MTIQGIAPGPQVMTQKPELFWGLVASMWIGNAMLVILNLPLVGMWVQAAEGALPAAVPGDHGVLCIGIYSVNNSAFDVYLTALFGIIGFLCMQARAASRRRCCSASCSGPMMEENLRRALLISRGDPTVFFTRPISLGFMIATVLMIVVMGLPRSARSARRITDVAT